MRTRLLLISHPATAAQPKGAFPADEPLDARAITEAARFRASNGTLLNAVDTTLSSPAACALDTARALGLDAAIAPDLADIDYGRWRGKRLSELADEEPEALAAWTRVPSAALHGGESFDALMLRVGYWLDAFDCEGTTLAITHAPVIRAALLHVLRAPSDAFARIEIAPLSIIELQRGERGWTWWPAHPEAPRSQDSSRSSGS
ncbi:histidine phosphatase family protein [Paraburkholderia sp. CNPSo 3157]|uniref:Histidine phosphatase family protein n=1 Tax=Paraburkholderia franconis TaxID=2654983 RepID=A0A7X1NHI1_9BURK|nr:histidine phosphatase family protein [Paraburkholderia franconis]MPW21696.1 histidine phosphatase family protein [Paraburkholderia franconis]